MTIAPSELEFRKSMLGAIASRNLGAVRRICAQFPIAQDEGKTRDGILYDLLKVPIKKDDLVILDLLLEQITPNYEPMQLSALCVAAGEASPKVMAHLVDKGFGIRTQSVFQTPLDCAVLYDRAENVEWLLDHGAALGLENEDKIKVFMIGSMAGSLKAATTLVERGIADAFTQEDVQVVLEAWSDPEHRETLIRLIIDRQAMLLGQGTVVASAVRLPPRI